MHIICTNSTSAVLRNIKFKVASPAHLDSNLFMTNLPKGLHNSLYAKQVFYRTQAAKSQALPTSKSTITQYLGPSTVAHIEMELKCILWAQALLQLSYDYIKTFYDNNGPHPPHLMNLPQFQFVHAALAVEQSKPSRDTRAFLLEEEIDEATEGKFHKYFNNTSLVPCQFKENTAANILCADFLAFTQHLQFWKTGKLVFMEDYQGGNTLLTETQIITHPSIGEGVFASGNLLKNWETFKRLHQCTQWCKYYELPHDYDECDGANTNLQLKLCDLKVTEPPIEILDMDSDDEHATASDQPHPILHGKQDYQGQPKAMSLTSLMNPF